MWESELSRRKPSIKSTYSRLPDLPSASAVREISPLPDYLLIDGPIALDLMIPQRAIIKGDRLSVSVASAAILAKVTRDRLMMELHDQFPQVRDSTLTKDTQRKPIGKPSASRPLSCSSEMLPGVRELLPTPLFGTE